MNPSPSEEFQQIKQLKYHTRIGICFLFTWFNLQILNLT